MNTHLFLANIHSSTKVLDCDTLGDHAQVALCVESVGYDFMKTATPFPADFFLLQLNAKTEPIIGTTKGFSSYDAYST